MAALISFFGTGEGHCATIGFHEGACWNCHVAFGRGSHAHTEHHDHGVGASMAWDIGTTAVVPSVVHGVSAERDGCQ